MIFGMEAGNLRESATDAIRYWEPRRVLYNLALGLVVVLCFVLYLPASRLALTLERLQQLFILAVLANVAYCAAYPVDVFAQVSAFRDEWRSCRWILFTIGILFAAILTRFITLGMFQEHVHR
jgi:hypothetical protein